MSKKIEKGYLYISCGEKYIEEAIVSATSLRRVDRNAHITLITDLAMENKIFDIIKVLPMHYSLYDKVKYIYEESPYERTFYLDADTYFYSSCDALFNLLDYFDICMPHAPAETEFIYRGEVIPGYVPYCAGTIIYRKDKKTEELFRRWREIHENIYSGKLSMRIEEFYGNDQVSFAIAWLHSDVKIYVLPENWHMRFLRFNTINDVIKMVHGRGFNYIKLRSVLNSVTDLRCWDPYRKKIIYKPFFIITQERIKLIIWFIYRRIKSILSNCK